MVSFINKDLVDIIMTQELRKTDRFSNFLGLFTLVLREQRRFTSIWTQTLLSPIVTSALFITVFSFFFLIEMPKYCLVISILFLAPGILMMKPFNSFKHLYFDISFQS